MTPNLKIAVAGATGRVGGNLVDLLESSGHDVIRMSRTTGVDVITGEGLAEALAGADRIVDAATGPSPDETAATEFFTTAARNLQTEGERAGVERIVVVSIIGIDKFAAGYYAAKVEHERANLDGPIPAQILRASQFHEFIGVMLGWGTQGDVGFVPAMKTQPILSRSVAEAVAELVVAGGEPANAVVGEIAGPREERLADLARQLVEHRGDGLDVQEAPVDGDDADAALMANGAALPGPDARLAGPSYAEWLSAGGASA